MHSLCILRLLSIPDLKSGGEILQENRQTETLDIGKGEYDSTIFKERFDVQGHRGWCGTSVEIEELAG